MKTKKYIFVISTLITTFIFYNFFIYTSEDCQKPIRMSAKAMQGQELWQNNNCWSCHQIYGLGGYLGPDLTNVFSHPNKGKDYIKAFLNSGVKSMPKFDFSEEEKEAIATYLELIDKTGYYPNHKVDFQKNGWVEIEYKNEK